MSAFYGNQESDGEAQLGSIDPESPLIPANFKEQIQFVFAGCALLVAQSIVTFVPAWYTRHVSSVWELTPTFVAACLVNFFCWVFLLMAAIITMGLGIDGEAEHCRMAFVLTSSGYLLGKLSVGAYIAVVFYQEMERDIPRKDRECRKYLTPLIYMLSAYVISVVLVLVYSSPELTPDSQQNCIFVVQHPYPVGAVILLYILGLTGYMMHYTNPRNEEFFRYSKKGKASLWYGILPTAIFPIAELLYLLISKKHTLTEGFTQPSWVHGNDPMATQSAWGVLGGCLADMFFATCAVWWVEGEWKKKEEEFCECNKKNLDLKMRIPTPPTPISSSSGSAPRTGKGQVAGLGLTNGSRRSVGGTLLNGVGKGNGTVMARLPEHVRDEYGWENYIH